MNTQPSKSPMMTFLVKTAIVCAIPKAIDAIQDFFTPITDESEEKVFSMTEVNFLMEKAVIADRKEQQENTLPVQLDLDLNPEATKTGRIIGNELSSFPRVQGGNSIRTSAGKDATRFCDSLKNIGIVKPKIVQKTHDMRVFTRKHFDYIVERHTQTVLYNKTQVRHNRITVQNLCDQLNQELHLDKGITSYSKVYLGHQNRSELPVIGLIFPSNLYPILPIF